MMSSLDRPESEQKIERLPAERRQLTVVFVDVVDATSLSERLDPEDFFSVLRDYRDICEESIRRFGGHLARMVGDGLLAYFGLPRAHEDDAERAVRAALSIVSRLQAHLFSTAESGPARLNIRIGINTGLVVIGSLVGETDLRQQDVFGAAAHVAARLQAMAPANCVLIGPRTYELVRGTFRCACLGAQDLKGIEQPIVVWQVDGLERTESRFERTRTSPRTPLVDRVAEHAMLLERWAKADKGSGSVVVISGDPGIGKSRLVHALRLSLVRARKVTLHFQCSPLHVNTPLAPLIERDRHAAGVAESNKPAVMLAKLRALLSLAVADTDAVLPYYGALLSIPSHEDYRPADLRSPSERKRALAAIIQVVVELSRRRSVMIVVEDIQWVDATSIELLEGLVPLVRRERILLILTHRSDYQPYWLAGQDLHAIPLTKLTAPECEKMVRLVAGPRAATKSLTSRIIERTDGIPLFIEEFTRAAVESNRSVATSRAPKRQPDEPLVPISLQDSLMERLDALGDGKRIAQVAAVIGRKFNYSTLSHLLEGTCHELHGRLADLEAAGLLFAESATAFVFQHAMIQEAAYASLPRHLRAQLHARAASYLRQASSESDGSQLAVLAHHYARAGMILDAARARLEAGKAALAGSANREAIANLWEGVEVISNSSPSQERFEIELALQANLAMAYTSLAGWSGPQVDQRYSRALELCRNYGTVREKSIVLWGITIGKLVGSELTRSLELARGFVELADEWHDEEAAMMAHTADMLANFFLGRLQEAKASAEWVLNRYDHSKHCALVNVYQHDPKVLALVYGGHMAWLLGHPQHAKSSCEAARQLARELAHPFMLAFALILGVADYLYEGDHARSLASVEEGVAIARQHGLSMYGVFGALWAIPAFVQRGPNPKALEELSTLLATLLENNCYLQAPLYQICLAREFSRFDQVERARTLAKAAEVLMKQTGERWFEPEVYRVRAVLFCEEPNPDYGNAIHFFARSLAAAKELKTAGWELRAAISFARLLRNHVGANEAVAILTEAREKFSRAEKSADLAEAEGLLRELRSGHESKPVTQRDL